MYIGHLNGLLTSILLSIKGNVFNPQEIASQLRAENGYNYRYKYYLVQHDMAAIFGRWNIILRF